MRIRIAILTFAFSALTADAQSATGCVTSPEAELSKIRITSKANGPQTTIEAIIGVGDRFGLKRIEPEFLGFIVPSCPFLFYALPDNLGEFTDDSPRSTRRLLEQTAGVVRKNLFRGSVAASINSGTRKIVLTLVGSSA